MSEHREPHRFRLLTSEDLDAIWKEHRERMARQVVVEDEYIGFPEHDYWVKLNRINSYKKLVGWVTHLLEKGWATSEMMLEFIERAGRRNRLDVHGDG